jgi:predicted RNase H-like HicB family nuclease
MKKREFEYKIEYEIDKKSKKITAVIPELNHISSFGDSFAEAEANIKEAALGYIETVMKEKTEMPKSSFHSEGTYIKIFAPTNA